MKKKAWIISTLTYIAVFAVCIGVLYFMKWIFKPGREAAERLQEYSQSQEVTKDTGELEADQEPSREVTEVQDQEETEETEPEIKRETGYQGWSAEIPMVWPVPDQEELYLPPKVILATDLHYQSSQTWDRGKAFQTFVEQGDGKVVEYLPQLLEAFLDEVIEAQPAALILSGDITMNGELANHQELADRLKRVQEAGIQVLVIPGNHDINNTNAAFYFGDEKKEAPFVDGQGFYEIYHEYGYDQALSRDSSSLSYVYEIDEKNRLLLLDSCQYDPRNLVEGRLKTETLEWMEEQLAAASQEGVFLLPIAHHNLLAQSRMYTTQCAMENNEDVIALLQKYELPLFLSGHLHVQRIKKYKSEPGIPDSSYGIQEIITDAFSIPPCQYGVIQWKENGSIEYATRAVDVSAWAAKNGSQNQDLLDFESWSFQYIESLIEAQIEKLVKNVGEDIKQSMALAYAGVYIDYYAGRKIDKTGVRSSNGYKWWLRNMPDSYLVRELDAMLEDSARDNNYLLLPEEQGWE